MMTWCECSSVYGPHCANSDPLDSFCGVRNGFSQSVNKTFTINWISPEGSRRLNCSASRIRESAWKLGMGQDMVLLWEVVKFGLEILEKGLLLSQLGRLQQGGGGSLVAAGIVQTTRLPFLPSSFPCVQLRSCFRSLTTPTRSPIPPCPPHITSQYYGSQPITSNG